MLVNSIRGFNIFSNQRVNAVSNRSDYSPYLVPVRNNQPDFDTFTKSQPNFTAIKNTADFRDLANHKKIHCIYCGRPMMGRNIPAKLKLNGVFSGPIINFTVEMIKYLEYLHPVEKEMLKKITVMAFDTPQISLSEAIKKLYPQANKELLQVQKPILKELSQLGKELPYGWKTKFQRLLQVTRYRLEERPYIPDEFSGKEFAYKINRVRDSINDKSIAAKMFKLTEPLTHPVFKNQKPLEKKFINKILTLTDTKPAPGANLQKSDLQRLLINKIKQYAESINRKDIKNLCDTAINTIDGKPVKIKFSNKSFRYDLNEVLEGMPNQELHDKIFKVVRRLPNSQTNVNSFITKHELAASDAIGYDLLRPSLASIEHMHPKSQNGSNSLSNYALACERDNNKRSNEDMKVFIEPFDIKNQQKYFQELMDEAKRHNIPMETVIKMIQTFTRESGRSISAK